MWTMAESSAAIVFGSSVYNDGQGNLVNSVRPDAKLYEGSYMWMTNSMRLRVSYSSVAGSVLAYLASWDRTPSQIEKRAGECNLWAVKKWHLLECVPGAVAGDMPLPLSAEKNKLFIFCCGTVKVRCRSMIRGMNLFHHIRQLMQELIMWMMPTGKHVWSNMWKL